MHRLAPLLLLLSCVAALGAQSITTAQLENAASDTSSWLSYGRDPFAQRFVRLTQITPANVTRLRPAWVFATGGDNRGLQATPLIYQGVLYLSADQSRVFAIDARTGRKKWSYDPKVGKDVERVYCCGSNNRGVALWGDLVFVGTMDARLIALHRDDGHVVWETRVIDWQGGYSITGAPLVVKDMVLTGVAGGEFGVRGFVKAFDARTGAERWTTYTIPGPGEPGNETWPGDTWQHGGGSTWITGSYDPDLHTVFWGIGNPGPFNAAVRKGDNLYTDSVLALDPKTGKIKWHYQFSPNDPFDYDSVAEMILADMTVDGKSTKVVMDANRNGFFYVLDRTNGRLLAANPYVNVNWASRIDLETGRPVETDIAARARAGEKVTVLPSILGGKNWSPMSFDPQTGFAYANTLNFGGHYKAIAVEYKAGDWYLGMDLGDLWEWPDGPRGYLKAIEPLTGKAKWEVPSDIPRFSGVLSTAGKVVFSGRLTGEFEAFDADTGAKLRSFQIGSGIEGQPITREQDGVQYVAVSTGIGGVYSIFSGDERLKNVPAGGSLWVFALHRT